MKIYTKLVGVISVEAGNYELSASMDAVDIYKALSGKSSNNADTITIVFKEGKKCILLDTL